MTRMTLSAPLVKAWIALIALSLGSALLTVLGLPVKVTGAAILALALAKARVILMRYLGLDQAPSIGRGVTAVLSLFTLTVFGLFLI